MVMHGPIVLQTTEGKTMRKAGGIVALIAGVFEVAWCISNGCWR